jgi:hypothetical protein
MLALCFALEFYKNSVLDTLPVAFFTVTTLVDVVCVGRTFSVDNNGSCHEIIDLECVLLATGARLEWKLPRTLNEPEDKKSTNNKAGKNKWQGRKYCHRPLNVALRFSAKARIPSAASEVLAALV